MSAPRRLTYPAPSRVFVLTGREVLAPARQLTCFEGRARTFQLSPERLTPCYSSAPWDEAEILRHVAAGGWFDFNVTEFASDKARRFARGAQDCWLELRGQGDAS